MLDLSGGSSLNINVGLISKHADAVPRITSGATVTLSCLSGDKVDQSSRRMIKNDTFTLEREGRQWAAAVIPARTSAEQHVA